MARDLDVCVYCGAEGPATRDHVPPKGIFAAPRPSDLITVPCCLSCRKGTGDDDEYFRNEIVLRHDVADRPDASRLLGAVMRSYRKPRKRGFRKDLLRRVKIGPLRTPSGLMLGQVGTYETDLSRHCRVVDRVVRGLYYHDVGVPLPPDAYVRSLAFDGLRDVTSAQMEEIRRFAELAIQGSGRVIGPGTFAYRMAVGREEHVSVWFLVFYEAVQFLAFTTPHPPSEAVGTLEVHPEEKGPT